MDNVGNTPPFTLDLQKLFGETAIPLDRSRYDYLGVINSWNIETRYPDYRLTLHKLADRSYMNFHLPLLKDLHQWLLSRV